MMAGTTASRGPSFGLTRIRTGNGMEVWTEALAAGMFIDPPDGSVVSACRPLDEFGADVMRKLWIILSQSNERGRQFLHHG